MTGNHADVYGGTCYTSNVSSTALSEHVNEKVHSKRQKRLDKISNSILEVFCDKHRGLQASYLQYIAVFPSEEVGERESIDGRHNVAFAE